MQPSFGTRHLPSQQNPPRLPSVLTTPSSTSSTLNVSAPASSILASSSSSSFSPSGASIAASLVARLGSGSVKLPPNPPALIGSVPHVMQSRSWDCGLACVAMVLQGIGKFPYCTVEDVAALLAGSDSVWTIDLAYLLRSFDVVDLTYYTSHIGVNWQYSQKVPFYKDSFSASHRRNQNNQSLSTTPERSLHSGGSPSLRPSPSSSPSHFSFGLSSHMNSRQHRSCPPYSVIASTVTSDTQRVHTLFAMAHEAGIRVVPTLISLDDLRRFLLSDRYAIIMLVDLRLLRCGPCKKRAAKRRFVERIWKLRPNSSVPSDAVGRSRLPSVASSAPSTSAFNSASATPIASPPSTPAGTSSAFQSLFSSRIPSTSSSVKKDASGNDSLSHGVGVNVESARFGMDQKAPLRSEEEQTIRHPTSLAVHRLRRISQEQLALSENILMNEGTTRNSNEGALKNLARCLQTCCGASNAERSASPSIVAGRAAVVIPSRDAQSGKTLQTEAQTNGEAEQRTSPARGRKDDVSAESSSDSDIASLSEEPDALISGLSWAVGNIVSAIGWGISSTLSTVGLKRVDSEDSLTDSASGSEDVESDTRGASDLSSSATPVGHLSADGSVGVRRSSLSPDHKSNLLHTTQTVRRHSTASVHPVPMNSRHSSIEPRSQQRVGESYGVASSSSSTEGLPRDSNSNITYTLRPPFSSSSSTKSDELDKLGPVAGEGLFRSVMRRFSTSPNITSEHVPTEGTNYTSSEPLEVGKAPSSGFDEAPKPMPNDWFKSVLGWSPWSDQSSQVGALPAADEREPLLIGETSMVNDTRIGAALVGPRAGPSDNSAGLGDGDDEEGFAGHYILLIGYDPENDSFFYRDPGTFDTLCVTSGKDLEAARGSFGTDHDVIVVKAVS